MVCGALQKGNVMAIFGPQDDYIAEHIKSITDMIEIPFIDTRQENHDVLVIHENIIQPFIFNFRKL